MSCARIKHGLEKSEHLEYKGEIEEQNQYEQDDGDPSDEAPVPDYGNRACTEIEP